jgi:dTDP-4-amino-4,6-dideoxygalactose transaminase
LIEYLKEKRINLNVHYIPIHYHSYFKKIKNLRKSLPNTERYFDQAISLPIYPDLKYKEQKYVVDCINDFLSK